MAVRKAETETPGGSALEARAESAVVKLEAQPKAASSDQLYEAITPQIMYPMSTITNENLNNNVMGVGNFPNLKGQREIERT